MRRLALSAMLLGWFTGCALLIGAARQSWAADSAPAYEIGPGDILRVDVAGRPDLSGQFTVGDDGSLTIPIVGSVPAGGETIRDLQDDLSRRISLFQREIPQVTVTVTQATSRKVYVLGSVLLPGAYAFKEPPTVWDAIMQAGGPTVDADLQHVELIPGDITGTRSRQVIDVAAAIRDKQTDALPRLGPGDTARVPSTMTSSKAELSGDISMLGAVARQGTLPLEQATDLVTALVRSGGPAGADLSHVEIVRRGQTQSLRLQINMEDYFKRGSDSGNPPLKAGDVVYVRRAPGGSRILNIVRTVAPVLGVVTTVLALTYGHW